MNEVYHLLSNMVKDTGSETYFLSILQHLLLIRNDYYIRPQYYKVIEECVSQVVLHRSGMDPDFGYSKRLDVDFNHLIDQCVDKAKVEESEQNAAEYSKKFDEEFSARQEAQAESQKKEEKIKELEGKIQALESQLTIEKDKLTEAQRLFSESEAKIAAGPTAPGPPPPPPLPGGGPPPPPSLPVIKLPYGLEAKKIYKPETVMKRVNWTKIVPQEMAENCFWIKVKEEKFENPDLFAQLSQCFSSQSK
ncbi:Protein diaphanous like 2, partial [Dissostichus eleginoides]